MVDPDESPDVKRFAKIIRENLHKELGARHGRRASMKAWLKRGELEEALRQSEELRRRIDGSGELGNGML